MPAKKRVQASLMNTNNNKILSPLEWWRENGGKYRNMDRVAPKWLAVPVTSTPNERVFLIFCLVDTAKR